MAESHELDDEFNYGPDHTPKPTSSLTQQLQDAVDSAIEAKAEVERLTSELESAKKKEKHYYEDLLPRLMQEANLGYMETPQGLIVEVDSKPYANIPAPSTIVKERDPERRQALLNRRTEALAWLDANGHSDLIKRSFEIEFSKEEAAWAATFRRDLAKRKKPLHVVEGEDVNHNTLSALIRTLLKDGVPFPKETLGVFTRTVAKVSRAKAR